MTALSDEQKIECDLRAAWKVRERAREQMTEAMIAFLSASNRFDTLLDRYNGDDRR